MRIPAFMGMSWDPIPINPGQSVSRCEGRRPGGKNCDQRKSGPFPDVEGSTEGCEKRIGLFLHDCAAVCLTNSGCIPAENTRQILFRND